MIGLNLDTYSLSSSLPESFPIDTQEDYVDVAITLQGQCIYETRLYANNGYCTFYELRQIVEQNMIARRLTLASFEVMVDDGYTVAEMDDKYIIFSRHHNTFDIDLDFLQSHFLVNRAFVTIPRESYASVPFFDTGEQNITASYDCVFLRDGELWNYHLNYTMYLYNYPHVYYMPIGHNYIKNMVNNEQGEDCGKLLSFTVHVGSRSLTVYVVDERPAIAFTFLNSYNAYETIFIIGTTTHKTEISRKEAVTQNITSFYDKSVSRKWEVKTVPLSQEEAMWFNDFLESDYVTLNLSQEHNDLRILISDITSEISDSSKDKVHMKFSWRFDDNSLWLDENRYPQVFTAPYNDTFK